MEEKNKNEGHSDNNDTGTSGTGGVDENQIRLFGILGYIIPILFFLPLVTDAKNNEFAKFHANQQLILLLFYFISSIVASVLAFLLIGFLLYPIIWIFGLVCVILGIMNVVNERKKPLPLIGEIATLIK